MNRIAANGEPGPPDFLTVEEAATVLRLGRTAAYRLVRRQLVTGAGGIPVVRYGKQFRVPRALLERDLGGPITWPPTTPSPDPAPPVTSVKSPPPRPRTTDRRSSGDGQSPLPFSA